jgi:hypothetical protein
MSNEKAAPGRPTKFRRSFVKTARKMCQLGATDRDLAEIFEVATVTIWRWATTHAEFANALKVGKAKADERVVRALYQRAVGYSYDTVKVFQHCGTPVIVPFVEHVPPDPGAAFKWLCNRRPEDWREKVTLDGLPEVAPIAGIDFVFVHPEADPCDPHIGAAP